MKPAVDHRRRNLCEKIFRCRFHSLASQIHSAGYVSVQNNGGSALQTLAILIRSRCRERSEKQLTSARLAFASPGPSRPSDGVTTLAKPAPRRKVMLPNGLLWLFDKPGVAPALARRSHSLGASC